MRHPTADLARTAAVTAYAPYSGFKVGCAAVFAPGRVFFGANIENASYGLTLCAERAAISAGVSAGCRKLRSLALACLDSNNNPQPCFMPCGACLQVIAEFAEPDTPIFLDAVGVFLLRDLLPSPFLLSKTTPTQ